MVEEIFGLYERAAAAIECARRERHALPPLQHFHEELEDRLDLLVATALGPQSVDRENRRVVRALTDLPVWRTLLDHGLSHQQARELVTSLLICALRAGTDQPG